MAEGEGELHEPGSNVWMHAENVPVKIVPAVLEAQWQALIEENHPALIHLGEIVSPSRTVSADGVMIQIEAPQFGPWFFDLVLNPGNVPREGDADRWPCYYPSDIRMRFECSRHGPPRIRILSPVTHFMVTAIGSLHPSTYSFFKGETLSDMFHFLCNFFLKPVHPCAHCNEGFEKAGKVHFQNATVARSYMDRRNHPPGNALFDTDSGWLVQWFDPKFWSAHQKSIQQGSGLPLVDLTTKIAENIYSIPMFTDEFCDLFCDELDHFQTLGLPAARPNSMNNYGLILNKIGFEPMMTKLQQEFLKPLFAELFPTLGIDIDMHHTFTVQYKPQEDRGLDMHTDDSHITINVCLGKEFTGAKLHFCGKMGESNHRKFLLPYQHVKGQALIHLGRQRHGACDIETGERVNLIMWSKSCAVAHSKDYQRGGSFEGYAKESEKPDELCLSYTHDKDYSMYLEFPEDVDPLTLNPWCPPPGKSYDAP